MAVSAAASKLVASLAALVALLAIVDGASGVPGGVHEPTRRDRVPPSAPVNLRVTSATPTTLALAWDRSADNVGVRGYYVWINGRRSSVSRTTYTATGLRCGASVQVRVAAYDRAGNRSPRTEMITSTAACRDVEPPSPPTGLRQTATAQDAVVLSWNPSTDNVGVVGYGAYTGGLPVASTSEPTLTLTGLSCGSAYEYKVDAVDAAGNRSRQTLFWAVTADCADEEAPSAPSDVTVTERTASSLSLEWSPATDNVGVTGYRLTIDGASGVTVSVGDLRTTLLGSDSERALVVSRPQATLLNLACGTTYAIAVHALDAAGNTSPPATARPATEPCSGPPVDDTGPPSAPANLAVLGATRNSISLGWTASTDNVAVEGYEVYVDGVSVQSPSTPGATVTGLDCGTVYAFGVEAHDAAGNRSARAEASAATASCAQPPPPGDTTPPSQPANLSVPSATATSVSLTWSSSTDDVGVTAYGVYRNGSAVTTVGGTGATVSGLHCGTSHTFEVDAQDAAGNRSGRAAVTASTSPCADTQPPTVPTNVTATSRTSTSIALSWSPSTDNVGVAGYGLYRAGAGVGTTTGTTGIVSGLTCNTNYTLAVDAHDAAGNRSSRTVVMVATTACPDTSPPTAPSGLAASGVTQTSVTLTWTASTDNVGVTGYDVYRNGTKMASASGTSSSQSGLACGTSYTFGVDAYDAAGNRSGRTELNASTAACSPPPTPAASTVWSAGMETGDLSEWNDQFNSDGGSSVVSTERARSGAYSARQDIDSDGTAGTRLRAFGSSGIPVKDAYYSVWLYIPHSSVTVPATFNFMQWKGKTPVDGGELNEVLWAVYLQNRSDGSLFWRLSDKTGRVDDRPDQVNYTDSPLAVPTQRWTHLEVRYSIALDFTGAVQVWQDGTLIYDRRDVKTAWPNPAYPSGYRVDWYVNAYGDSITPRPYWHYLDDAAVATGRVGP
jgi:chitodextrinase